MFKNLPFVLFLLLLLHRANAQSTVTFENVTLNPQGYYNGVDLSGGYSHDSLWFVNTYNTQFQSWSGFGASSVTDTATAGFSNQYGCYAGTGAEGSAKFALGYVFDLPTIRWTGTTSTPRLISFQYTNSTFAGLSMKNGDAFSKKFGGTSGNDPDYFKLLIYTYFNGQITDTTEIYLADYRFADNSQDFIVKQWRTANPFPEPFDSLQFDLKSTDNGPFGMNTPAYFCIDNLVYYIMTGANPSLKNHMVCAPNPATTHLQIYGLKGASEEISLLDRTGKEVHLKGVKSPDYVRLDIEKLPTGIYFLRYEGRAIGTFVKE